MADDVEPDEDVHPDEFAPPMPKLWGTQPGVKAEIDLNQLERLCRLLPTDAEVAAYFGVHKDTIARHRRKYPEFAAAMERGKEAGRLSVRREQLLVALGKNPKAQGAMLKHLGEHWLDQKPVSRHEHSGPGGGPVPIRTDDLSAYTTEELETMAAIHRRAREREALDRAERGELHESGTDGQPDADPEP